MTIFLKACVSSHNVLLRFSYTQIASRKDGTKSTNSLDKMNPYKDA